MKSLSSYIILEWGEEDERDVGKRNKNKKSFSAPPPSPPSSSSLSGETLGSRSGNRNSYKTTFYFRAIKFFLKDKILLKNKKRGKRPERWGRTWFSELFEPQPL